MATIIPSTDISASGDGFDNKREELMTQVYTKADWEKILRNNDLENTSITELLQSLRYGIPDELRPEIWEFLAQTDSLRKQHKKEYYEELKNMSSDWDRSIKVDVGRTFPESLLFRNNKNKAESSLFNVLRAYANHDKEIGYTQGMNFVVGKLLIIMDPENYENSHRAYFDNYQKEYEEKVFWIFCHITQVKNCRQLYGKDFPKMYTMVSTLEEKLKLKIPDVYEAFLENENEYGNSIQGYFVSMFLCLLLDNAPTAMAKRLLDLFFVEEEKILFKVIIRAIILCKKELLQACKKENVHNFLKQRLIPLSYEKCRKELYLLFPGTESSD